MKQSPVADAVTRAAVELFATQGYANTSVQQIVATAGVTKGAMYHYFQSKDDLLFGIYDRMLSLQKRRLEKLGSADGDIVEVLRAVCVDVTQTSIEFIAEGTVYFQSAHMLSPPRQHEVARRRREYHDAFAQLLERGRAEGRFRTDIPAVVVIAHFFSDLHYLSQWYSPSGVESAAEVAEQITDLFLSSILVRTE